MDPPPPVLKVGYFRTVVQQTYQNLTCSVKRSFRESSVNIGVVLYFAPMDLYTNKIQVS